MPSPLKKTTRITERVNLELRLDTRNMLLGAGVNFLQEHRQHQELQEIQSRRSSGRLRQKQSGKPLSVRLSRSL
jgi:hypothetical protein